MCKRERLSLSLSHTLTHTLTHSLMHGRRNLLLPHSSATSFYVVISPPSLFLSPYLPSPLSTSSLSSFAATLLLSLLFLVRMVERQTSPSPHLHRHPSLLSLLHFAWRKEIFFHLDSSFCHATRRSLSTFCLISSLLHSSSSFHRPLSCCLSLSHSDMRAEEIFMHDKRISSVTLLSFFSHFSFFNAHLYISLL